MGSKSLTALLTRRLIFIQAAIILVTMIGITYQLRDNYVSYIDSNVPSTIARAMVVDHDGELTLRVDRKLERLLDGATGLWFVAEDETGRRLEYGEIPTAYRGLAASVSQLQHANAHSSR